MGSCRLDYVQVNLTRIVSATVVVLSTVLYMLVGTVLQRGRNLSRGCILALNRVVVYVQHAFCVRFGDNWALNHY